MHIRSIANPYGPQRPAAPTPATRATPAPPAGSSPQAPAQGARVRQDSVTLSDTGRALAEATAGGPQGASALPPERVADLRRKVLEGAYNQTGVVEHVAKRLLSSGDV